MDTMALNSEYVGTMQTAIETYIADVETAIGNIKAFEITSDSGFYGTTQCATINGYVTETCEQINEFDEKSLKRSGFKSTKKIWNSRKAFR